MKSDFDKLFQDSFVIVSVPTIEDGRYLEEEIFKYDLSYKVNIPKSFLPKKVGPITLKVNSTMIEILENHKSLKEKGNDYIMNQIEQLDAKHLIYRCPRTLSYLQRLKFAMIMYTGDRKEKYLLQGCGYYSEYDNEYISFSSLDTQLLFVDFMNFIHSCNKNNTHIIFITHMNKKQMNQYMLIKKYFFDYKFYEFYNNELTLAQNTYVTETKQIIEDSIEDLRINGLSHNMNLLLDRLKFMGEVDYYTQAISVLDDRLYVGTNYSETEKAYVNMRYELICTRDKLAEAMNQLSESDRLYLKHANDQKIESFYILSYELSDDESVLEALNFLEEYNMVLNYDILYMYMAEYSLYFMNRNRRKGNEYHFYASKIKDYLVKAKDLGNDLASKQLDIYNAFEGNEDLEKEFNKLLNRLDEEHNLKLLLSDIKSYVNEHNNLYIYQQVTSKLRNLSISLLEKCDDDYKFVKNDVLAYYDNMELLGYKNANEEVNSYQETLKINLLYNEVREHLAILRNDVQKFDDEDLIRSVIRIGKLNNRLNYDFIYSELSYYCKNRSYQTHDKMFKNYLNAMAIYYLQKAADLGSIAAKEDLEILNEKNDIEVDEACQEKRKLARDFIKVYSLMPIRKNLVETFKDVFIKAKDGELWYKLSQILKIYKNRTDIYEDLYQCSVREAIELGNVEACMDYLFEHYNN